MTLQDIIADIHALREDLEAYETKYGVLLETFYESYMNGEEPEDQPWVLDWANWAGAHKILLRRYVVIELLNSNGRKEPTGLVSI